MTASPAQKVPVRAELVELRQLRCFVAVAEEMHFGRAAARMHIVQPAISRQIASLESRLGFQLFVRRPLALTPAARNLLDEARAALQLVDRAVESAALVATGELGTLQMGYIQSAMKPALMPILREYRTRAPTMGLDLAELDNDVQIARLHDGLLDLGFLRPVAHDNSLVFETLMRERLKVALPMGHPQAAAAEVALGDLRNETFIVLSRERSRPMNDLHFSIFRQHGFLPKVIEGNTASALNLIALKLAVAIVPETLEEVGIEDVVFRPIKGNLPPVELAIAYRRNPSAGVAEFLDTVRDVMKMEKPQL